MTTRNVPEPVLERLRSGHRFVLTSHLSPDGDAVGSEIGLARLLQKRRKGAVIWNRDPTPRESPQFEQKLACVVTKFLDPTS